MSEPIHTAASRMPLPAFDADEALARVDGDRELLAELVDVLGQESPALLDEIRRSAAGGDAPSLQRAAHKLRGSVLNFGAHEAAEAAQTLETLGRAGTLADAGEHVTRLEHEYHRLMSALRRLVPAA